MTLGAAQTGRLRDHYSGLWEQFGPDHRAVQWSSAETQAARFRVLSEYVPKGSSVLDVGAGLGDFLAYLRERGFVGEYRGVDLVPEFRAHASQRFREDHAATFEELDILSAQPKRADIVIASGLFNNRLDDNWTFLTTILTRMFDLARVAVVFNAMSTYVDYQDPELYYVDPLAVFDFAKRDLTQQVVLRHDYLVKPESIPFEFAMVLFKSGSSPR